MVTWPKNRTGFKLINQKRSGKPCTLSQAFKSFKFELALALLSTEKIKTRVI